MLFLPNGCEESQVLQRYCKAGGGAANSAVNSLFLVVTEVLLTAVFLKITWMLLTVRENHKCVAVIDSWFGEEILGS